ncbi:hypothetical protein AB205_0001350 [Aquarana catesbeiana]|uniref:Uncharacterized protein n=1 Tax=Aquarana catesbeiana TaxID=8400 RepID=A0A2G9SGD1_AQUCT|nr:hypothetical protein AB205_0001350 [Aquarana catesbeiana]
MNETEYRRKHSLSGSINISSRFASTSMIYMKIYGMDTILSPFWRSFLAFDYPERKVGCDSTAFRTCRLRWISSNNVR